MTDQNVREQGRVADSIGIFPEFIDGYGLLILPTTGRYFQPCGHGLESRTAGAAHQVAVAQCCGVDPAPSLPASGRTSSTK